MIIEAVGTRPVGEISEVYTMIAQQQSSVRDAPSVDAVTRFEAAMEQVENAAPATEAVQPADLQATDPWVIPAVSPEGTEISIGDRILDGMGSLRDGWSNTVDAMQDLQEQNNLQPADMLSLQFQMSHTSLMLGMVSQEVGSITQKIDGLLRVG